MKFQKRIYCGGQGISNCELPEKAMAKPVSFHSSGLMSFREHDSKEKNQGHSFHIRFLPWPIALSKMEMAKKFMKGNKQAVLIPL